MKFKDILETELLNIGDYRITASTIVTVLIILITTKLLLWIVKKALYRKQSKDNSFDSGNTFAIYQIIRYLVWVVSIAIALETIGVKVTILIAGSAALLVGLGLGLQQTFNDFISGIIILSERSIKINDILEIDDEVIKIDHIGLRTSKGINRNNIALIIPNSSITRNKVINWSHQSKKTRFSVEVGVSYGSDIELVEKVLTESALEHPNVDLNSEVEVRIKTFNNSSVDFEILFFSDNIFRVEKVKSDIRKILFRKFNENGITIPFPQMDLHFMSDKTGYFDKK